MSYNFYDNDFPSVDDIVFAKFVQFDDMKNAIVSLVEYSGAEGMLQPAEICKRNIRPEKVFKKGTVYPCVVVNIDKHKKHIDLSYIKVPNAEKEKYMGKLSYLEKIVGLGKDISFLYSQSLSTSNPDSKSNIDDFIFENTIHHVFKNNPLKTTEMDSLYSHLLEFPAELFKDSKELEDKFVKNIVDNFSNRIKSTETTIESIFSLTVIDENAVTIIKKLLTESIPKNVKLEYFSGSKYKVIVTHDTVKLAELDLTSYIQDLEKRCGIYQTVFTWDKNITVTKKKTFSITPLKKL